MDRSRAQTAPASSSRVPAVSRAIHALSARGGARLQETTLQVEFVGGPARWRFVEEEPCEEVELEVRASRFPKASSQPCLHEVTIAGGWGERSERERRLTKLASKLGYIPGLPRQRVGKSRLDSFLPAEYRAGAFKDFKPPIPKVRKSSYAGDVAVETRQHLRILKLPEGDRLVVKRWAPGFFEAPSRRIHDQSLREALQLDSQS
ncbi:unnamed protein product [Durusdinium trenchii]|uniref:Uncharacterized protein n=1 Tax=Durusdinium trenchii TaxID=1381693 RepID=A0ABP0RYB3_9DINO